MGSIVDRVKALGFPLDEIVVIGSGLLDAYGLREASDVDLVASEALFNDLKQTGQYDLEIRHNDEVLLGQDIEIWRDWGETYEVLVEQAVVVKDVRFASPRSIIEWKQQRGTEKDLNDIRMLEEYLNA